jgi:two-component system OmpR family sensor kinase
VIRTAVIRRGTLAQRISLLACAIAVITALLAGALAIGLINSSNSENARSTLSQLANAAQATADLGARPEASQQRARRILQALKIQSVTVSADGQQSGATALGRAGINEGDISRLLGGGPVSRQTDVFGQQVLVEGSFCFSAEPTPRPSATRSSGGCWSP